ncbi:MAG: histidine kinase [Novosphingobium sp.]|nr:histidine kinase [Novosphingobium sp.]
MIELDSVQERPRVPFSTVLASVAGLWAFYFVMTTLRGIVMQLDHQAEMLVPRLAVSAAGAGVTLILWLLMRPFDMKPLGLRIAIVLLAGLPGAVLIAQINDIAFARIEAKMISVLGEDGGVRIQKDGAGNILVDIPGLPPVPPVPPVPPGRPEPPSLSDDPTVSTGRSPPEDVPPNAKRIVRVNAHSDGDGMSHWQEITDVAIARYFLLVAWAALYQSLVAGERMRGAERRAGESQRAAKAAELRSLRYQVNPHFLFNSLNSLSALVLTGKADKAEQMIQTISTFYRRSLASDPTGDVPLAEEFAQQRSYLEIEEVRFPQRLRTIYDLPPELESACVPGMILQPLVENSVKYAVAPTSRTITIRISARAEGDRIVVTVSDDGNGETATGLPPPSSHGIGLQNVRQRLEARFGDAASLVTGRTEHGYETTITIPWVRHER